MVKLVTINVADLSECKSSPCHNGATCDEPAVGTYRCTCMAGFTGTVCAEGMLIHYILKL